VAEAPGDAEGIEPVDAGDAAELGITAIVDI
jgi:hypothetical protein